MAQIEAPTHPFRSTVLHVVFAFVAMGGWAAFANRGHGVAAGLAAFLVQGVLSAGLTLLLKRWLEWAHARWPDPAARAAPPLISCLTIATVLAGAHGLAGTPQILHTIAVPWTVSTLYAFAYVFSLDRQR